MFKLVLGQRRTSVCQQFSPYKPPDFVQVQAFRSANPPCWHACMQRARCEIRGGGVTCDISHVTCNASRQQRACGSKHRRCNRGDFEHRLSPSNVHARAQRGPTRSEEQMSANVSKCQRAMFVYHGLMPVALQDPSAPFVSTRRVCVLLDVF